MWGLTKVFIYLYELIVPDLLPSATPTGLSKALDRLSKSSDYLHIQQTNTQFIHAFLT